MKRYGRRSKKWIYLLLLLVLAGGYSYWAIQKPLPLLKPVVTHKQFRTAAENSDLTWPADSQAAVGILGSGILETHGKQKPVPIASTAKVITALVALRAKPLDAGQSGPSATLTDTDVAIYRRYIAQNGSRVPVMVGEKISQYQMLQAMLLPSANNMADSLAIWTFGSLKAYAEAANLYLAQHGLINTHVGADASGLSPTTTSTAEDLVKLGELAMQQPVLAEIVGQKTVTDFPVAKTIKNVNFLLGTHNIIGVKTGNSDPAGGAYISASRATVNNQPVTIITSVVGSPTLFKALKDSTILIDSAQTNFHPVAIIKYSDVVGTYKVPWGGIIPAITTKGLSSEIWKGSAARARVDLKPVDFKDRLVGSVTLADPITAKQSAPVALQYQPRSPTIWWRLIHPF